MTDKKLECFVISPIGSPGTSIRKEADWVLKKLIRPALADSYNVVRADEFTKGEIITNRVITSIQNADLLVAVMSGHNPNVFYELAVAHAYSRPVVQLIKEGESIPFDVGPVGTIFYSHDDVNVWDTAIGDLKAAADATRIVGYQVSNPITMALGAAKASASPDSTEQLVAKLTAELATTRRDVARLKLSTVGAMHESTLTDAIRRERNYLAHDLGALDEASLAKNKEMLRSYLRGRLASGLNLTAAEQIVYDSLEDELSI